jgi:hypothetical protein
MLLAALLVQPDPPSLSVGEVVLDPHGDDGAEARMVAWLQKILPGMILKRVSIADQRPFGGRRSHR